MDLELSTVQKESIIKTSRFCRVFSLSRWRRSEKLSKVAAWPPGRTGYISVFVL